MKRSGRNGRDPVSLTGLGTQVTKRWRRYPKYKPSGVEWLGEVPEGWDTGKIRYFGKVLTGGTPNRSHSEFWDSGTVPWMSSGEVNNRFITETTEKITPSALENSNAKLLPINSVMIALNGQGRTKGMAAILQIPASCNQSLAAIICNSQKIYYFYLYYYFRSRYKEIRGLVGDDERDGLNLEIIRSLPIYLPPIPEQLAIASFLNRETARIDSLIEKKERQIELLKEKRAALISHAVTKGLDPNVKMKDSGVEWLGRVPEHWKLIRLRFLCSITTGSKNTEDSDPSGQYPFFVRSPTIERLSTFSFDEEAILTAGDGVGVAKVFHYFKGKFDVHQRVYVFTRFKNILGYFLFNYIRQNLADEVLKLSAKSTVDSLRLPMLQNFPVLVPPKKEQEMIIPFLNVETKQIDDIIQLVDTSIEKLHEYRSALISAAVTGKIDVRDEVKA